jgi:arylsulfatase A-like enzyme
MVLLVNAGLLFAPAAHAGAGAFRVPAFVRWPGHIKPSTVSNDIISGLDWFPTLLAVAGDTGVKDPLDDLRLAARRSG